MPLKVQNNYAETIYSFSNIALAMFDFSLLLTIKVSLFILSAFFGRISFFYSCHSFLLLKAVAIIIFRYRLYDCKRETTIAIQKRIYDRYNN